MFVADSWQIGFSGKSDDSQRRPCFGNRTAKDGGDQKAECGRTIGIAEPRGAIHLVRQSVAKLLRIAPTSRNVAPRTVKVSNSAPSCSLSGRPERIKKQLAK